MNQETDNITKVNKYAFNCFPRRKAANKLLQGKEIKETAQEDQVPAQGSNTDENLFQEEQNEETISKDAPIQG